MKRSVALLLALGIVVLLAGLNADFFFHRPYYEFWDAAANSLSILRAKHFAQLYGPYSRYGFYHPGAGYFYVEALGEWLFHDVLHVVPAPFNGQLLMHLCLTAGLFVAGLEVFTSWLPAGRRCVFVCIAIIIAILHFGATDGLPSFVNPLGGPTAFLSNWSAHFLVLPFFCLLTAGASVAAGRARELPLLVIAGGFLVHAHIAEPLFVVPTALLAYAGLTANAARRQRALGGTDSPLTAPWRENRRAHLLAGALLAVFLLPLILDLFRGHESNMAAILRHMHVKHEAPKTFARSLAYFLQFFAYAPYKPGSIEFGAYDSGGFSTYLRAHWYFYAGWLVVAGIVFHAPFQYLRSAARTRRTAVPHPALDSQRFLAAGAALTALAVALSLCWGTRQEGTMFYYNSWYNFGILYFTVLVAAGILCSTQLGFLQALETRFGWGAPGPAMSLTARAVAVGAVVLTCYLCAPQLRIRDRYVGDGNVAMHDSISRAIAASETTNPGACKILSAPLSVWSQGTAVGLQLARAGKPFIVPEGWEVTYGEDHRWSFPVSVAGRTGFCPWYVVPPGPAREAVPADARVFPLHPGVSLALTAPVLALSAVGDTAEINFAPDGHAGDYILGGWSGTEPQGRWTDRPWAALCLRPTAVAGSGVEMSLIVLPFAAPFFPAHVNHQRLSVFFNGEPLGTPCEVTARGPVNFTIPAARWNAAAALADPLVTLGFQFPDAVSPASVDATGQNQDTRLLGVHFFKMQFTAMP